MNGPRRNAVASGGLAVIDVTATTPLLGLPVSESASGRGIPVTKVLAGKSGLAVNYTSAVVGNPGAPLIVLAALDPATVAGVTLSNGNLTATHNVTTTQQGVFSTAYKTSGKYYFEIRIDASFASGVHFAGAITSSGALATIGSNLNCMTVQVGSGGVGGINSNGGGTGMSVGGACIAGDVLGFALDLTARKGWVRKGSGLWNGQAIGSQDPVAGVGGAVLYAAVGYAPLIWFGGASAINSAMTLNCGQSAFANAAPSSYGNWTV
jgi:hypothetical protein